MLLILAHCCCCRCWRQVRYGRRSVDSLRSDPAVHGVKSEGPPPASDKSLFRSEEVPLYVQLLVPGALLINVLFFLSGHISLGASVDVTVRLLGETFAIPGVQVFSLADSTVDMWKAGAVPRPHSHLRCPLCALRAA